jgi:hypothetical protein
MKQGLQLFCDWGRRIRPIFILFTSDTVISGRINLHREKKLENIHIMEVSTTSAI